jgi:uncharacterized protein (TIGR03083 family)
VILTPVYGERSVIRAEPLLADPATPLLRQRCRLADALAGFDEDQWAAPSRCEGWSTQDVIAHLTTTNQFWAFSIDAGLAGSPTTFLSTFDPVASPAEMVDAMRSATPAETMDQFVGTNAKLAATIECVGDRWSTIAEAPPGHLAIALVAQHALWDSWVHERDVLIPLGMTPVVEDDEVVACLNYAAALSPAFLAGAGSTRSATIEVLTTGPEVQLTLEVGPQVVIRRGRAGDGAVRIEGDAAAVLEAFSLRGPFPSPLSVDDRWVLDGVARAFDQPV